ncbi:hypothetical protein LDENG_00106450 [Lucifuga dentata]|nr:hypothetical protein LDENG_00106450 [Lucifuga dentata]
MLFLWCVAVLLLPAVTHTQSGDRADEPRISCSAHISQREGNSLTCRFDGDSNVSEDDEDTERDDIERMTLCSFNMITNTTECVEERGDTVCCAALRPITATFSLTLTSKRGSTFNKQLDLRKIVKPKSPQVWNVTFHPLSNQAVIQIQSPYQQHDYLNTANQLFQFHIWSSSSTMIQNMTDSESLSIGMEHLQKSTEYYIKVRAIPSRYFQGTWSEWSPSFTFYTHFEEMDDGQATLYTLYICLVAAVLLACSTVFLWKKKVHTYMWPSIPQPKHTLVQIYKPIKDSAGMSFIPAEVFNDLKIYMVEKIEQQHRGDAEPTADITQSTDPCSTQSSDCSKSNVSVSTEELEVSTLLSRSSAGEEYFQSQSPSPTGKEQRIPRPEHNTGDHQPEKLGVTQQIQDEAYVTMSSFYQIR